MSAREFIDGLSDEQRVAALTTDDPVMIIAGAGSGKTRTLAGRFVHLVMPQAQGGLEADPSSIMMVTFTNKAAREMRERIKPLIDGLRMQDPNLSNGDPWIGTFHSISLRILRVESERAGLGTNFSIFDDSDSRALAEDVAEGLALNSFDVDIFFRDLEKAKSRLLSAPLLSEKQLMLTSKEAFGDELTANDRTWTRILETFRTPEFTRVYSAYQRSLREQNAVDFSDLLNTVTEIFRANPAIRDSWRSTFRHFMVDEVQDINRAQAAWLDMLTDGARPMIIDKNVANNAGACASHGMHDINGYRVRAFPRPTVAFVGDDDQSIYRFRGSEIEVMHGLTARYDGLKKCFLKTSYRCQPGILSVANTLVGNNTGRFDKTLEPFDPKRPAFKVMIEDHKSPMMEIKRISTEVRRYLAGGGDPSEYAVLVRTRELVRGVARTLRTDGIPVVEGKASDIRKSAEVRDMMSFAGFLVNTDAETLLRRVINKPSRGLGPTSISKVSRNARLKGSSFIDELRTIMNDRIDLPDDAEPYGKAFINSAKEFGRLIVDLRAETRAAPDAGAALLAIMERTGYLADLRRSALHSSGVEQTPEMMSLPPREFLTTLVAMFDKGGKKSDPLNKAAAAADLLSGKSPVAQEEISMEDLADKAGALSETGRRIGNLSILIDQAKSFEDLGDFMQDASLEMDQGEAQAGVRVMTIHASKGLEFDIVRLPFWVDGLMPHSRAKVVSGADESEIDPEELAELQEERRLAYVAITRAREDVRISSFQYAGDTPFIRIRNASRSMFIDQILEAPRDHRNLMEIRSERHPVFNLTGNAGDCMPVPTGTALTGPAPRVEPVLPVRPVTALDDETDRMLAKILGRSIASDPEPDF